MLVLSRNAKEQLIIGDDIVITVVEIKSGRVRLAIQAPRSVNVARAEVRHRIVRTADPQDVSC